MVDPMVEAKVAERAELWVDKRGSLLADHLVAVMAVKRGDL